MKGCNVLASSQRVGVCLAQAFLSTETSTGEVSTSQEIKCGNTGSFRPTGEQKDDECFIQTSLPPLQTWTRLMGLLPITQNITCLTGFSKSRLSPNYFVLVKHNNPTGHIEKVI